MSWKSYLRAPSFANFCLARFFSVSSNQMLAIIVGWEVYDKTGSALNLGLVGLFQFMPRIVFLLHAGKAADFFERRILVVVVSVVQFLTISCFGLFAYFQFFQLEIFFALLFITGALRAYEFPSIQAYLANIVVANDLPKSIAFTASVVQLAVILGPTLGGALYLFGASFSYFFCAFLVLLTGIAIFFTKPIVAFQRKKRQEVKFFTGIQYIWKKPILLGAISLDLFAVLLGGATALMPIVAKDILHTNSVGLGMLRAAPAVGAFAMSYYLALNPIKSGVGKKMFLSVVIFGVSTILFGLAQNLWFALFALLLLGAADMVSMVVRGALVQLETPNEMRGRVGAVNSLFIGASNQLGEFESGVTAALFGLVPAILLGGACSIAVAVAWIYLFPSLWKIDRFASSASADQGADQGADLLSKHKKSDVKNYDT